ncbi:nucleolar and spindle-associated protein 1 isoform X2 [Castor canadensis]|uniref:Nucleolar and spindle-associated protein 1 isoform X2 n=1 Tax=Castor canadensis TaxID=51338 RepID=A0AC58LXB5_CASCN
MTVPSAEELDSFKYSDLQNLAKSLGLRANLRADKLLKALKAHLKLEARKGSKNQDENQTATFSCGETEIQINSQDQAKKETVGHVTKRRRRHKRARGNLDSQNQENQDPKSTAKVSSMTDQSQGDDNADSLGKSEINDNDNSKEPSERKPLYTDGVSKLGNNKRMAVTTPNFKKLHEARFKEMESIDEYVKRKRKHFEEHNSFNELKKQLGRKGEVVTPVPLRGRFSVACTPASQRHSPGQTHGPASRNTVCLKGSVKRSGLSASKMNVRFSAATEDNEHKRSLTKTPARKSPHVTISGNITKGQTVLGTPKLNTTKENSAVITPFKLTTVAVRTPVSSKKPVFDLKASLSRPLNYEPHKGKLKPWGQSKEKNCLNEHGNRVSFHKKTYKQPPLQTREEQRKKHEQQRKEKKAQLLGVRRGLIVLKDK